MTFSVRGALQGRLKNAWLTVRSCLLLSLTLCAATTALGQSINGNTLVSFGATPIGTPVSRTLTFQATTATVITISEVVTNGAPNLDYTLGTNTCTGTIYPPNTCAITIIFNPTAVGERNGAIILTDSTDVNSTRAFLYGIGQGAQFAFAPTNITALDTAPNLTPSTFTSSSAVYDGSGNLYFTDIQNGRVLERTTNGTITSLASLPVSANSSITVGPDGTLYVSALGAVYAFMPGGTPVPLVTTGVTLVNPTGLAVDGYAGLFIADSATGKIVRYSLTGSGSAYVPVTGISTPLSNPTGLAVDTNQNLYIADTGNNRVIEINPAMSATTPATIVSIPGYTLNTPSGIVLDAAGTIYVADTGNKRILELTPQTVDFALSGVTLNTTVGVAINTNDDLVLSDNVLGIILVPRSSPSITFPTPTIVGSLDTTDDPISLVVQASGNIQAELFIPQSGTDPSISTNAFLFGTGASCPTVSAGSSTANLFSVGQIRSYPVDFQPTQVGPNRANLVFQTSVPGGTTAATTTTVPLLGNGISGIASFSLVASPNLTTVGTPVSLTLTALKSDGSTATAYVGTITFTTTDSTGHFLGGTTYQLTAADDGVLVIPASSGIQFNQTGTFTVSATDGTFSVISNNVKVVNASSMSLTSSINPSQANQSTTFTATITSAGPAATGTVLFFSNGVQIGTGTLVNGVASFPYAFTAGGTYSITATYAGDNNTAAANAGPLSQVVLFTTTANSFTSSVNPSLINQSTTLTLTLSSSGPAPTGTVKFYNGTTLLCTATVTNGVASCPVTFTTTGTDTLTAVYSGDSNNAGLTAGPLSQVVVNPSSITLSSSVNPSLVNQSTTLNATLTTTGPAPTGTIKFYDNGVLIGSGTVTNGAVSISVSFTAVGIHPLTAVYSGDSNYATATSTVLSQDVVNPTSATSFTSSANPALINQTTTLTLTLSNPAATGTVTFYNGTTVIGTATIVNGVATVTTSFAAAGAYPLSAVYSGDTNNAGLTATLTQVVTSSTGFTLTSSINPSLVNQSTTLTATIASTGVAPTGTITFFDGTTQIGIGTIANGVVSVPVSFSTVGIHMLTAVYSGDANYVAATTAPLAQDVVDPSTITLTSSINPSSVGQSTNLTATILFTGPAPTGTVTFYDGSTAIGSGTVSGGAVTIPAIFTTVGTHLLKAVYSGDTNNASETSPNYSQIVVSASTITLTSSQNPSLINQPVTLTVTLANVSASPSGTVTFYNGTNVIGTQQVTGTTGSVSVSFTTVGIQTLTANYSGDANNAAATSAPLAQDVVNPDSVTLASSVNPVATGVSTTLTATITFTGTSPTGTISFYDGTTIIGTVPVSSAAASLQTSFTTAGTHNLTCTYSGDVNNAAATCNTVAEVVLNPANIAFTSSVNPANINQSTTLKATITSSGPTPTGTVKFYNGATLLCTVTLSGGSATCPASFATPGSYTLTAVYSGDNNTPTETGTLTQTVVNPLVATLTSSANPANVGASITFTATLTGFTTPTPTGSVVFSIDGTPFSTVPLTGATASITTSFPTLSTHTVTCVYSGDGFYTSTPCNSLSESVTNPTNSVLTVSPNPALVGQTVALNAVVTSTGGSVPTGTVTFTDGGATIGTGTLSAGAASFSIATLTPGTHNLSCTYPGDTADGPSACNIVAESVLEPSTIKLTSSLNPSVVQQSVTFTATVTSAGPTLTGTVKFYNGTSLLGTATLSGGVATLSFTFPLAGTYPITAVYSGDTSHQTVTSAALSQVVLNLATVVLTSSVNPIMLNNQSVLTAVVSSTGPTPTGTVSFFDGTSPIANVTLINGTATFADGFTYVGTHTLTAYYLGDAVTAPATSPSVTQTVGDFSIAIATGTPSTGTVMPGHSMTYSLVLSPIFTSTLPAGVTFSMTGAPKGATYTFTPATVASGSGVTPFTLVITAPQLAMLEHAPQPRWPSLGHALPTALALVLLPFAWFRRRKRLVSGLLMMLFAVGLTGCLSDSYSGYFGQEPKTYSITVDATSGDLTRSTAVTLTIQ